MAEQLTPRTESVSRDDVRNARGLGLGHGSLLIIGLSADFVTNGSLPWTRSAALFPQIPLDCALELPVSAILTGLRFALLYSRDSLGPIREGFIRK